MSVRYGVIKSQTSHKHSYMTSDIQKYEVVVQAFFLQTTRCSSGDLIENWKFFLTLSVNAAQKVVKIRKLTLRVNFRFFLSDGDAFSNSQVYHISVCGKHLYFKVVGVST